MNAEKNAAYYAAVDTANMAYAAAVRAAYRAFDCATANAADLSRPLKCGGARKALNDALIAASAAADAAVDAADEARRA